MNAPRPLLALAMSAAPILVFTPDAYGVTWRVEPDGSGNAPTIQAAINAAAPGDTVEVACGTYFESEIALRDGVYVTSETGDPGCVTIDAQQEGRVFYCSGVDSAAALVGLTITGGRADTGGGILCKSASTPRIESCVIEGNVAGEGGGIFCFHSSPPISDCVIRDNEALAWGGGLSCYDNASPTVSNCTIEGNSAGDYGGGVWAFFFAHPTLGSCSIAGNAAGLDGGGVHGISSDALFTDCQIVGNSAGAHGGGLKFTDSNATLTSCTVAGNLAIAGQGGGIHLEDSSLDADRSILWGNCGSGGREAHVRSDATLAFACSDVDTTGSWVSGVGSTNWNGTNFSLDPMFCAPAECAAAPSLAGEYGLQPGSPLLDLGVGCGGPLGAGGTQANCAATAVIDRGVSSISVSAFPNPFREQTVIEFELLESAPVHLTIYDATGRRVRTLADGRARGPGRHVVAWDGRADDGARGAAGVYFYRVRTRSGEGMHRLVRLR
ncbi:MAG: hypothetical protein DHS20C21_08940 [Gemmatimonadota bacterium]|nr:MAG: hypothetical protein DHS20C21_08940 [Gemmatimonadota bacterium]